MTKQTTSPADTDCPCGSGDSFEHCCGRYLNAGEIPATAERLMRSRYSAFALCDDAYLLATWSPARRPSRVRFDSKQRWLGLSVRATSGGGEQDTEGTVEFVARYKIDGKGHRMHEISRFEKREGRWFYLDGQHL